MSNDRNRPDLKLAFSFGFASVNCRTDSARVCVDILDHQGTSFDHTGGVETNPEERAITQGGLIVGKIN
jgi:hypothetical protein